MCVVMWNCTTHWWHYGDIVCRRLPLKNSSVAGFFSSRLVDSLWRRSPLQRWRSICSLDLSHSHNTLQLILFICSPDFSFSALLLSSLQILQTPPRVCFHADSSGSFRGPRSQRCVFRVSRPARFTWQCLLVSKNCSEVRVDGESRAGSAGRRWCGDRGGNGRAVT